MLCTPCKHIFFIATLFTQFCFGQTRFVFDSHNINYSNVYLLSYTWLFQPADGVSQRVAPVLNELPVNKSYFFFVVLENNTNHIVNRVVQFGGRYVTARNISIVSLDSLVRRQ